MSKQQHPDDHEEGDVLPPIDPLKKQEPSDAISERLGNNEPGGPGSGYDTAEDRKGK